MKDNINLKGYIKIFDSNTRELLYQSHNVILIEGKEAAIKNMASDFDRTVLGYASSGGYFVDPTDPNVKYDRLIGGNTIDPSVWDSVANPVLNCHTKAPRARLRADSTVGWEVILDAASPTISDIEQVAWSNLTISPYTPSQDCASGILVEFSFGPTYAASSTAERIFMINELFIAIYKEGTSFFSNNYPDTSPTGANARLFAYHWLQIPIPKGYNQTQILQWAFYA